MKRLVVIVLIIISVISKGQCIIKSLVQPNGQIHRVSGPELLYVTKTHTLFCAARNDGAHYYFELVVKPTFFKRVKKEQVEIILSNGTKGRLDFYDAHEVKKD